jgi:hypothetical protein
MQDIRLPLLMIPEDRYEASPAIRAAERAIFPLLRRPAAVPNSRRSPTLV